MAVPVGFAWIVWGGVALASLPHPWSLRHCQSIWPYLPLLMLALSAVLALTVDFNFIMNLKAREEIVRRVAAGEFKITEQSMMDKLIELPLGYQHLSKGGGDIWVEGSGKNLRIFFFTDSRYFLSHYSAYMYQTSDAPPETRDGDVYSAEKLRDHWFRVKIH